MKALVYQGPGSKSRTEVPDPELEEDSDAIVRVDVTTLCGTDLHMLQGDTGRLAVSERYRDDRRSGGEEMAEPNTASPRRDLLAADRTPLGQLALRKPVTVPPEATLREVANRLEQANVSSALIYSHGLPREFVSERDLARGLAKGRGPDDRVEAVATKGLVSATTTTTLGEAADMMVQHEIRHLVVLASDGEALGVLSMRDVFPVLLRRARQVSSLAEPNA
jgi:CBS domain-containing protein